MKPLKAFSQISVSITFAYSVVIVGCSSPPPEQVKTVDPEYSKIDTGVTPSWFNQEYSHPQTKQSAHPASENRIPPRLILNVPLIRQGPELKNGCEVTSLAMLLQYAGHDTDKMTLAKEVRKDPAPLIQKDGDIKAWGNPNHGFVGDMTGKRKGFAVYNKPLETLMRQYMGHRTVNITGQPFQSMINSVGTGHPVVVWTTGDFTLPTEWASWRDEGKTVTAPFDEHAVLLVGYDPKYVYVNDPLSGVKQQRITRSALQKSWEALGKQALTYK